MRIHVMVREGSAISDLSALRGTGSRAIYNRLMLVTDGVGGDLLEKGYLKYVVQKLWREA